MPDWNAIFKHKTDGSDVPVISRNVTAATEEAALEEAARVGTAEGIDYDVIEVHQIDPDRGFILGEDILSGPKKL